MSELKVQDFHGKQVIDSRDVAQMVERDHKELMKSIRLYSGYLGEGGISLSDFFIESAIKYISDEQGTMSDKEMRACTAVMSSYNRIGLTWAGGSIPLIQNVLREEWGFEGLVITDFDLYEFMYPDQAIAAGSDLILSTDAMKGLADTKSATAMQNLRKACHNILYTVAHSHAMNGIVPGTIISYTAAPWEGWLSAANIAVGILLAAGATWVIIRVSKNRGKKL